jgi:hypothetical protein
MTNAPLKLSWQIWPATNLPAPACPLAGAIPRQPSQARADLQAVGLPHAPCRNRCRFQQRNRWSLHCRAHQPVSEKGNAVGDCRSGQICHRPNLPGDKRCARSIGEGGARRCLAHNGPTSTDQWFDSVFRNLFDQPRLTQLQPCNLCSDFSQFIRRGHSVHHRSLPVPAATLAAFGKHFAKVRA